MAGDAPSAWEPEGSQAARPDNALVAAAVGGAGEADRPGERRRAGAHRATRREPARPEATAAGPVPAQAAPEAPAARLTARFGRLGTIHADRVVTGIAPDTATGSRLAEWYLPQAAAAWVAGRLVVAAALGLVHFLTGTVDDLGVALPHSGLLGWDAGWYRTIATNGYAGAGDESRRFFPLLPTVVHVIGAVTGHQGAVLLVVVNAAAFALLVLLARLARAEGFSDAAIRRALWLTALAPPSFVLVMGYSEALAMLFAVAAFLAARRGRWWVAALAGTLSGLSRPLGLLLVAPLLVEALRGTRTARFAAFTPAGWARRAAAVVAPAVGAGIYLAWSAATYHDGLAPLTMQREAGRHGATRNPVAVIWDAASGAAHGNVGTALHVPWVLLAVIGLVVMARLLPASYTVWSVLVLLTVLTGSNLDSSERYLLGAFPFVLVVALVTGRRTVWPFVLACSTAMMTVYATLAFTQSYVP